MAQLVEQHAFHLFVVGMADTSTTQVQQLRFAVTNHRAEGGIDVEDAAIDGLQRDTDRSLFEKIPEALLAFEVGFMRKLALEHGPDDVRHAAELVDEISRPRAFLGIGGQSQNTLLLASIV